MQMEKFKPDEVSDEVVWPKLISGTLIRRYNRFLADVKLRNHRNVTAHCPNSGSMKGCSEPGRTVYLSRQNNPKRKLKYNLGTYRDAGFTGGREYHGSQPIGA